MIREASCVGVVLFDPEVGFMIEQAIQHVGRVANSGVDHFRVIWSQNVLTRALQEYGRLNKTIFILRYLLDEPYQRRIGAQINKGEALHALRGFLFVANEGKIRRHYDEEQLNQVSCLNLVTNAVVLWNTVYMSAVLDQLRSEGYNVEAILRIFYCSHPQQEHSDRVLSRDRPVPGLVSARRFPALRGYRTDHGRRIR
jgi:Tn3 transposase DDE domain